MRTISNYFLMFLGWCIGVLIAVILIGITKFITEPLFVGIVAGTVGCVGIRAVKILIDKAEI